MKVRSFASLALVLAATWFAPACSDDSTSNNATNVTSDAGGDAASDLPFTTPPVTGLPEGVRFASVSYGSDPSQMLDVFLPASTTPTAVVLYIHGGGFTAGSRADAYKGDAAGLHKVLEAGVAWIGVEYRLLQPAGTEKEGVIKSLRDCQRALQFVRHSASKFNIDPKRVGSNGSSAGAGASMWLAFHDDMANAASTDEVEHESTRPQVIGVDWPQSTYDVMRWAPEVLAEEYSYLNNDLLLKQASLRKLLVQFYGLDGALQEDATALLAALDTPAMKEYRANVDMLAEMSSDDPPSYFLSDKADSQPLDPDFDLLHHPLHGKAIVKTGTAAGAQVSADVPAYNISSGSTSTEKSIDFILQHLKP